MIGCFFLLVFLCACIKEPSIDDRLLCLDISSFSEPEIPRCESQQECLLEVQKAFGESSGEFPSLIENNLSELKNRVALSWLYFNRALKNLQEINKACLSMTGLEALDTKANELNHNLVKAFDESDKAHQLAFSILFLQKSFLEQQKVELIKEEPLFENFILIENNLNELNEGNAFDSDSFAFRYFLNSTSFLDFSKKVGFEQKTIVQTTVFDIVNGFDDKILLHVPKKPFVIPVAAGALEALIQYVSSTFTLDQTVELLKSNPSFELFNGLNRFVGTKNSSIQKFFELNSSLSQKTKTLQGENNQKSRQIESELQGISQKISEIDEELLSGFDQNFLAKMAQISEQTSSIQETGFEISDFSNLKEDAKAELVSIRQEFNDLSAQDFFGKISIGEKTFKLKELLQKSESLNHRIDFGTTDALDGLIDSCEKQIASIEAKLKEKDFDGFDERIFFLSQKILGKVTSFKNTIEKKGRLLFCKEISNDFELFSKAIDDFDEFELLEKNNLNACIIEVKTVFDFGGQKFSDLSALYSRLLAAKEIKDTSSVLLLCQNLREKAMLSFEEMQQVKDISSNHAVSKMLFEKLQLLQKTNPDLVVDDSFFGLQKKFELENSFFNGQKLLTKALPNLTQLQESSFKLSAELNSTFARFFSKYLQKNSLLTTFGPDAVQANSLTKARMVVVIKNDLTDFNGPIQLEFAANNLSGLVLSNASSNVKNASLQSEKVVVELNSAPAGVFSVEFFSENVLAKTTENTKTILLVANKALLEKDITVNSKAVISVLAIKSDLVENTKVVPSTITVLFRQKPLEFVFDGKKVSFNAKDVFDGEKINIFYEIENPLEIKTTLLEQSFSDENAVEYVYSLTVKNNTTIEFNNAKISFPLPSDEKNFSKIEAFNQHGKRVTFEKTILKNISINVEQLFPAQQQEFLLKVQTNNYSDYWQEQLSSLEKKISFLSLSNNKTLREKANLFSEEIEKIKNSSDLKNNKTVEQIVLLSEKVQKSVLENNFLEVESAKFFELQKTIEKEVVKLNETSDFVENAGFKQDATILRENGQKALAIVSTAKQRFEQGNKDAFSDLLSAKNLVSSSLPTDFADNLRKQKDDLIESAKAIFDLKIGLESKSDVAFIEKEFLNYLEKGNALNAADSLRALKEKTRALNEMAQKKAKELFTEKSQKIKRFNELSQSTPQKIDALKKLFSEQEQSAEFKYFFPTTLERLDKLSLKFGSLVDASLVEKVAHIIVDQNDFSKNIAALSGLGKDFEAALNEMEKIDQNEFVEAMQLSKKAIGLLALSGPPVFDVPLAVIPLIAIIVAALFFRHKKKIAPLPQKIKIERAKEID